MTTYLFILIWLVGLGSLAYHRVSLVNSSICILGGLVGSWLVGLLGFSCLLFWLLLACPCLLFLNSPYYRKTFLSSKVLAYFQKSLPKISATEQTALQAGTIGWDGELFSGNPNWKQLHAVPVPKLTAEEQAFMDGPVETLCSMICEWEINYKRKDLPKAMWDFIKKERFFGLIIPKSYGGLEFSAYAHSEILAKIGGQSATVSVLVSVPNSLGPAELLLHYGTEEQKSYYLPNLATGKEIPCFALTNPEAGSDATSIPDLGIVCKEPFQGKETLGIRLTWEKHYITLAPIATVLGLAFNLKDPEELLGRGKDIGITCALIPANHRGVKIGNRHMPLCAMFQNGPTQGKNVFIPLEWVIGGEAMVGQGWRMLVECLSTGRAISLPSITAGVARSISGATGAYARIRTQFRLPIGYFEGVQEPLARIASQVYRNDAVRKLTAQFVDEGQRPSILGAIVKYHVTQASRDIACDAMDIHGGKGIMMGPKNYLAYGYINAPIGITVEGANILTRCLIIFGQGAVRCHPYITQELAAAMESDPEQALTQFDKVLIQHIGYTLSNKVRSIVHGLTRGRLIHMPDHGGAKRFYQWVTWASSSFAYVSDICMALLGGKLKFKESLSARFGDMLSDLYLASAVLKRFADEQSPAADLPLLEWTLTQLMADFWEKMDQVLRNFPNCWLGCGIRLSIMPFGRPILPPSDKLTTEVAKLLLEPNPTRERLLAGAYQTPSDNNLIAKQEQVLKQVLTAEPIMKRVYQSLKEGIIEGNNLDEWIEQALQITLITKAEADTLRSAEIAKQALFRVDDFSPEQLSPR